MTITQFPETVGTIDYSKQALIVPGSEEPGYTPVYRNAVNSNVTTSETVYDLFAIGLGKSANKPCLGHRPWDSLIGDFSTTMKWITYAEVEELRTAVGSGLAYLAKEGKLGEGVGLSNWMMATWCQNRPEFQIIDQSSAAYSRFMVSLYDTYDLETATYVLSHSEAKVCYTTSSHIAALLSSAEELPNLKVIVLLDTNGPLPLRPGELTTDQLAFQWAAQKGVTLMKWQALINLGKENIVAHNPPKDNSTLSGLCYTSGTTGKPKAAKVSHRQLAISAGIIGLMHDQLATPGSDDDLMISYLPLAHIYERILESFCLRYGAAIGYFSGDVLRLIEDAQIIKPTFFPGVPRVFNRIAGQIMAQADGPGLKGKLLSTAIAAKLANHDKTGVVTHAFYDRLVFRKVRAVLGGRVKIMTSGSAPIRPSIIKMLRVCFSCEFREGYGQTENAGTCLMILPGDLHVGSCGPPVMGSEVRLKDCPELNYRSSDTPMPRGELIFRGQSVFDGYYKDEAKTKETIDKDGWMYSGDIAQVDSAGRFYIIDRVKNLIKLSQGEYVAIENVEGKLSAVKYFAQFWLYGDSTQDHLVAVAVPDPESFAPFASHITGKTVTATDVASLQAACEDKKVTVALLSELMKLGRQLELKGFEIPRALKLRAEPFTAENGLLTPTMKMKRPEARKIMAKEIDWLYSQTPAKM